MATELSCKTCRVIYTDCELDENRYLLKNRLGSAVNRHISDWNKNLSHATFSGAGDRTSVTVNVRYKNGIPNTADVSVSKKRESGY